MPAAPRTLGWLLALCCGVTACGPDDPAGTGRTAVVFAAASLTEAMTELGGQFEDENPGTSITFNFGSSSGLATQLVEQGGGDVFASANRAQMQRVAEEGLIFGEPAIFASNRLQIIVPAGNPKGIESLADLADEDLSVILAASQVPVGEYAREALRRAQVEVAPVSEAVDVKGVVGPVVLGEADAGIVYATDVRAAGDRVEGIDLPARHDVEALYPLALVRGSEGNPAARAFVDYVLAEPGQAILEDFGFEPAPQT